MKVLLFGSTGLVGRNVLKLLVRLPQVECVYCPVRREPALSEFGILEGASKVDFDEVDFEQIISKSPDADNAELRKLRPFVA